MLARILGISLVKHLVVMIGFSFLFRILGAVVSPSVLHGFGVFVNFVIAGLFAEWIFVSMNHIRRRDTLLCVLMWEAIFLFLLLVLSRYRAAFSSYELALYAITDVAMILLISYRTKRFHMLRVFGDDSHG